jgi:thioredoxin 1
LTPILQQVKDDLGDGLIFIEIDVDLAPSLVKKYKVRGMPTLIIFKNKEPLWRHSGMIQKVDLETIIRDYS